MKTTPAAAETPKETTAEPAECEVISTGHTKSATAVSRVDRSDFKRLDQKVRRGAAAFMEVGKALMEIHSRGLWKLGGYRSWEAYCRSAIGMSKAHVHRLIDSSRIAEDLKKSSPRGDDSKVTLPVCEGQVRALAKIKDPETRALLWQQAVKAAEGQPTRETMSKVVAEHLTARQSRPELSNRKPGADANRPAETLPPAPPADEIPVAPAVEEEDATPHAEAAPPNESFCRKWLTMLSEIRREVLGQNSSEAVLRLTDELRVDIESAMPPHTRRRSNSNHN